MDSYDKQKALITVDDSWVEFQEIIKDIVYCTKDKVNISFTI